MCSKKYVNMIYTTNCRLAIKSAGGYFLYQHFFTSTAMLACILVMSE